MTETARDIATELLFRRPGLDPAEAEAILERALDGCDDGELFLEHARDENIVLDQGHIDQAAFTIRTGFGLRAVSGAQVAFAHGGGLDPAAMRRAAATVAPARRGHGGIEAIGAPPATGLYGHDDPLESVSFADKVAMLGAIDAEARRDPRVRQVQATLQCGRQVVAVMRPGGFLAMDVRPLVRLMISVEMASGARVEGGGELVGGRIPCAELVAGAVWRDALAVAMRRAELNLDSVAAPAGQMPVVIGPGWNAVLLHEAVGHGLEGDCIRRGTSVFAGLAGTRVAAPGVTVIDDGTLSRRRGSLAFDDEGTPTGRTVLIEDGILTGFMQDRLNARLMGTRSTGNGRRQSHAHPPIPRMTTTFMPAGPDSPEELIEAAGNGMWIGTMSGGNVEPATGAFAFSAVEARLIENGRLGRPVKNVTLIGKGNEALLGVRRIGNDFAFDRGTGTCGKDAQCVPVGCGQPSLLIDGLTVGGTGSPL